MKDFLTIWIILQLIFIGLAGGETTYEVNEWTFVCNEQIDASKFQYSLVWLVFPLVFFTNSWSINRYCDNKLNN